MQYYNVYLLFGSNLGERTANIANAITQLENQGLQLLQLSSLYDTEPWGNTHQASFLNQAAEFDTGLSPQALMKTILKVEQEMGRTRTAKWEPRIIDIDILFYGNLIVEEKDLKIPHPEVEKRKFALAPMAEIAPHFLHPRLKKSIRLLLSECSDKLSVNFFQG